MEQFKNIYSWLEASGIKTASDTLLKDLLLEEMKEFFDAKEAGDKVEMKNAIIDMIYIVANISYFNGLAIEELTEEFRKVKKSNASKYCNSEKEAQQTVTAYFNGTHPDKLGESIIANYEYSPKFDVWVVKRPDGKILKSINYIHSNDC